MSVTGVLTVLLTLSLVLLLRSDDRLERAARNADTMTINATYCNKTKTLTARQTINYRNRSMNEKSEVKFHIFANAYREDAAFPVISQYEIETAFPNGKSFGRIDVGRVYVNNSLVETIICGEDYNLLIVELDHILFPRQIVNIEINYVVYLANIAHRLGYTDRVVNLGNFYPVPVMFEDGIWMYNTYSYNGDPFFNDVHNFNVTLTKPEKYIMASSGMVIRSRVNNGMRTTLVRSFAIRDWAAVLSPYFQTVSRTTNRVTVSYYFLDDPNPNRSLDVSVRSLQTFSRLFVRYPFRQLSVVQTDFLHGGMEYGEIVFISTNITDREEIDQVIIHEIAHQWWYGIVGNDQVRTAWIDEGLAEYSTLLFFDENPEFLNKPRDAYINLFRSNLANYMSLVHGIGGEVNQNMNRKLHDFANTYEYVFMTYVRGMLLFSDLERLIGRANMITALRKFSYENMFGIARECSLIEVFERTSGLRLGLFFQAYLQGI